MGVLWHQLIFVSDIMWLSVSHRWNSIPITYSKRVTKQYWGRCSHFALCLREWERESNILSLYLNNDDKSKKEQKYNPNYIQLQVHLCHSHGWNTFIPFIFDKCAINLWRWGWMNAHMRYENIRKMVNHKVQNWWFNWTRKSYIYMPSWW